MHTKLRALARRLVVSAAAFAVVPFAVEVDPVDRDTSFTTFTLGVGTGSYADVTRGCSGEILSARSRPLSDVGFGIEHERNQGVLGVRASRRGAGIVGDDAVGEWVMNPNAAYEGKGFGLGVGVIVPDQFTRNGLGDGVGTIPVTGHIRTGNRQRGTDFLLSFGENVPSYTPGGAVEMTQGFRLSPTIQGRIGVAGPVPFDGVGLIVRTRVRASDALGIELRGRLGKSSDVGESTIGLGVTYRIAHQ